jgi:putative FmdB family regulatory protein
LPLYEYQCGRCGRFEVIRKFSDAPLVACPTCGEEVQKLPSAPAIQFKGTGWYITDYARKSSGGESAKDGATKDGSSKEGSAKDGGGKAAGATEGGSKDGAKDKSTSAASGGGSTSSDTSSASSTSSKTAKDSS